MVTNTTNNNSKSGPNAKALTFLMVITFLNGLGFGVIGPVTPFIIRQYIANPADLGAIAGWLTASYAFCSIIAAPALGLLSDRYGRRPILLICLLGSAIGYLMFGLGGSLVILFSSRIIDGITGGNFSIAFAYVADCTAPQDRPKVFGRIGAVNGISFLIGPTVGGLASNISLQAPAYLAAALTVLAILWGYFFLPESLDKANRRTEMRLAELNPLSQVGKVLKIKALQPLLALGVLYAFPFAVLGGNFGILIIDSLHWGATEIGFISVAIGLMDILVQGWLFGKLLPIFGTKKLFVAGFILQGVAYGLIGLVAIIPSPALVIIATLVYAFSSGLVEPSLGGLTSQAVSQDMQGLVGGASQSLQSLCRVIGPIWVGFIYTDIGHSVPYFVNVGFMVLGIVLILTAITVSGQTEKTDVKELQPEKVA